MESKVKRITALVLLITMFVTTIMPFSAYGFDFDGTQSSWAEPELKEAFDSGLTYSTVMNNYKNNITREEFCILIIKLYEKLTGISAKEGTDPFNDTDNKEILKAYKLGIVQGTSTDTFSPFYNITRQEICVMIFRTLNASGKNSNSDTSGDFPFKDASNIASWAIEAMKFAYKNQIMKGLSPDTIDPLSNTTREQGIVLLLRTFKKYSESQAAVPKAVIPLEKGPGVSTNQQMKYEFMVNTDNIFFPKFDERIELFVSTKPGKPATLPAFSSAEKNYLLYSSLGIKPIITPTLPTLPDIDIIEPNLPDFEKLLPPLKERPTGPVYTKTNFGAFIEKGKDTVRWFAFKLNNASNASKIIYQVSTSQFPGYKEGWNTLPSIVYSGEVSTASKEFPIDFSKIVNPIINIGSMINKNIIPQKQKAYYVRAVPVDASGNPIGDPGKGVAVLYGETKVAESSNTNPTFELWTPFSYQGVYSHEFNDEPRNNPSNNGMVVYSPKSTVPRLFHFHGIDEDTKKIIIQVSDKEFENSNDSNIVYEKEYTLPVPTDGLPTTDYMPSVLVTFSEFGMSADDMKEYEFIYYYVRGIALKDSSQPGKLDAEYSDVVTVQYGYTPELKFNIPAPPELNPSEKIKVSMPTITIKSYTPAQWPDPNYAEHYYVASTPNPIDINCSWKNKDEVLKPYAISLLEYESLENYQKAINRVLAVQTRVYIPDPTKVDKPWYQELLEGATNFFNDIINLADKLYSTIKNTYTKLKTSLIEFVAKLCPAEYRGLFETVLRSVIDGGLMALGIPPELPDFAALASGNVDYLVDLAITEAGVPKSEITDALRKEMEGKMYDQFKSAGKAKDDNPLDAPFLKLDPNFMYRPAYVELELINDTDYATVPGTIDLHVEFRINKDNIVATSYDPIGLNLVNDTNKYEYDPTYAMITALAYDEHFKYGLNGYTVDYAQGEEAVYEVFTPMIQQKIPSIQPHQTETVKLYLYLEPSYTSSSSRYPTAEGARYEDFYNMYFNNDISYNNGNSEYTWFVLSSDFPTPREYLISEAEKENKQVYLDPNVDYYYINQNESYYLWDVSTNKYILTSVPGGSSSSEVLRKPVKHSWAK